MLLWLGGVAVGAGCAGFMITATRHGDYSTGRCSEKTSGCLWMNLQSKTIYVVAVRGCDMLSALPRALAQVHHAVFWRFGG